jgi:membrane fusion protein (multidrug efflux system)
MSTAIHLSDRIKSVAAFGRSVIRPLFGGQTTLFSAGLGGLVIAGAVFAAVPASVAPQRLLGTMHAVSTDNAYLQGDITPISPKISGYIAEVAIHDNQEVKAGDVLFRIDARDYQARVDQATAGVATRRAALANLASRIEFQQAVIERAVATLNGSSANAERATRDFGRARDLTERGWASQARRDQAEADHLQGQAKVAEAEADLAAARRQLDVLESQRPQLQADIDAAAATLRLAQIDLEDTVVRAPSDGRVGERQAKLGQYVRPGTLVLAIVPHDVWVVANFKETQLPDMHVGDDVTVSVDAVPGVRFAGRIQSFSPASGAKFALLPPDNATGNFTRIVQRIPVKITFLPGQLALDDLRPGMSAVVKLKSAGRESKPRASMTRVSRDNAAVIAAR